MTYLAFNEATPNGTQTGTDFAASTRANLLALRDMAALGIMPGWSMSATGGTPEAPTLFTYSKSTERLTVTITWGTVGGALGNAQTLVYAYSSNSGGAYDTIGTKTITYDSSGNVTASTWS